METKQTNEMPTKATTATKIHNSKHFPFIVVETEKTENETTETKFRIAINNQIISEKTFDSLAEAEKYIGSRPWELIINLIGLTYQIMHNNETK